MRTGWRIVAVVVLMTVVATSTGSRAAKGSLQLEDPLTGEQVDLDDRATVHHVVFLATWCSPCLDELDRLADLEDRWGDRGYRLTLVAVRTRHTSERLARFVKNRRPPGRLLFDADGVAEKRMRASQLPTHLLFDANGGELLRANSVNDVEQVIDDRLSAGRRR